MRRRAPAHHGDLPHPALLLPPEHQHRSHPLHLRLHPPPIRRTERTAAARTTPTVTPPCSAGLPSPLPSGAIPPPPPCTTEGEPCEENEDLVCDLSDAQGSLLGGCVPPCTTDHACPTGEICRDNGACTPPSCADGEGECAFGELCDETLLTSTLQLGADTFTWSSSGCYNAPAAMRARAPMGPRARTGCSASSEVLRRPRHLHRRPAP